LPAGPAAAPWFTPLGIAVTPSFPPKLRRCRAGLLLGVVLALCGAVPAAVPPAQAAPVRTVLSAEGGDGSWRFLSDLALLWRNRYDPTPEQLVVRPVPDAEMRLRDVNRGRGDFAVVDVGTAVAHLSEYPNLTTLAVLWPNLLQALSRNPAARELKLPLPAELWVLDSADYAYPTLRALTRNDPASAARVQRVPQDVLIDALDYSSEPILLFTAPAPLREVSEAMQRDGRLQMLPIANKINDELKLAQPWLVTEKLGRGAYPGLDRNVELPAVYMLLVGRRDLPAPTARKVLDTVYGRASAMALFDPLFGLTNGSMNAVYAKLLPFHPETARRFNFTPSVP
jgi:hypothetical protein